MCPALLTEKKWDSLNPPAPNSFFPNLYKKTPLPIGNFDTVFLPVWHNKIFVILNTVVGKVERTLSANFTQKRASRRKDLYKFVILIGNNIISFTAYRNTLRILKLVIKTSLVHPAGSGTHPAFVFVVRNVVD